MGISARRKSMIPLILGTIAVAAIAWVLVYFAGDSLVCVERQSGPMLHEAYVWQRQWDTAVGEAIERAAGSISGFTALGTEVEPDWFILKGRFSPRALSEIRSKYESEKKALPSTADEIRRTQQHAAVPNLRFHYRYTAIQHARRAAELMPDNSEETARVLCIAGSWLKAKDPNEADRFY